MVNILKLLSSIPAPTVFITSLVTSQKRRNSRVTPKEDRARSRIFNDYPTIEGLVDIINSMFADVSNSNYIDSLVMIRNMVKSS